MKAKKKYRDSVKRRTTNINKLAKRQRRPKLLKMKCFMIFTTDSHENDRITSKYLHILKTNREV